MQKFFNNLSFCHSWEIIIAFCTAFPNKCINKLRPYFSVSAKFRQMSYRREYCQRLSCLHTPNSAAKNELFWHLHDDPEGKLTYHGRIT